MKKIMAVLTVLMCFASTNVFAQEVRGIETKRVIYEGEKEYSYEAGSYTYSGSYYRKSTKYYGWKFTNLNSCAVSVDISMYRKAHMEGPSYDPVHVPAQVIATKSIVLQSGESYVFKNETSATQAIGYHGDEETRYINDYYVEYKAFKLQ